MAHLTTNPAAKERFICIYPVYLNSKKTLAEGRRISAEKGVENPSCAEIKDVLSAAGLNVHVEGMEQRCTVQRAGKDVMFYVAEMIPKLKTRTQKSGGGDANSQQADGGKKNKKKKK
ncbi:hypothetical protein CRUP_029711 [Coryphaenoides rupestris]|nr:hypothetical protein CRUP_029711 [Coryphaenoides rupestris]